MYSIVGLGNPGAKYKNTRHNAGFRVIDLLSRELGVALTGRRFRSKNARTRLHGETIVLLNPQTFMNRSGESVRACLDYYGLDVGQILVVHDDVDMQVGRIRVVRDGGAGGHKGVLSVIQNLDSMQFPRVKIGIGRPRFGEALEDFVLSPFYRDEIDVMEKVLRVAVRACIMFVSEGIEQAMNNINCENLTY